MNTRRIKNWQGRLIRGDTTLINIPKYVELVGSENRVIDGVIEHHHEDQQYWHYINRPHKTNSE